MIPLSPPKSPFTIDIVPGIAFTCQPLTAFDMQVARNKAQRIVDDLVKSVRTLEDAGLRLPEGFDPDNPDHIEALRNNIVVREIGLMKITGWTGIKGNADDADLPVEPQYVEAVLGDYIISDIFFAKITEWHVRRLAAKKEYGAAATGTPAAAPNTAPAAAIMDFPVPEVSPAPTENAAPL